MNTAEAQTIQLDPTALGALPLKAMAALLNWPPSKIYSKKKTGEWKEGEVWIKRDGEIFILIEGYRQWATQGTKASSLTVTASGSTSTGEASGSSQRSSGPRLRAISARQPFYELK